MSEDFSYQPGVLTLGGRLGGRLGVGAISQVEELFEKSIASSQVPQIV